MAEPVYTLEEARQFVVHAKNNRPTFNSIKTFQNAVLKALHKLNDPDLWHQHRTDRGFVTRSFMERVFPAMPESHCKRLVFPNADSSHGEALPLIDPSYTAKVVELATQREMERNLEKELAEIYLTIDAIDLNSDPFPVDLGEAARWLGYSGDAAKQKGSAKRALLNLGYKENSEWCLLRNAAKQAPQDAHNAEEIRLTAECFKDFCLQSGAKRGPLIRKYFIEAEQRFRALTKSDAIQVSTNPDDLENVVRRVVKNETKQQLTAVVGEIGENLGSVEVKVLTAIEAMQQQLEALKIELQEKTPENKRRQFPMSVQKQVGRLFYEYTRGGGCLGNRHIHVIDANGDKISPMQFDHWDGNESRNVYHNCVPMSLELHKRKTAGKLTAEERKRIEGFIDWMRMIEDDAEATQLGLL